jgi:hypothetical protein
MAGDELVQSRFAFRLDQCPAEVPPEGVPEEGRGKGRAQGEKVTVERHGSNLPGLKQFGGLDVFNLDILELDLPAPPGAIASQVVVLDERDDLPDVIEKFFVVLALVAIHAVHAVTDFEVEDRPGYDTFLGPWMFGFSIDPVDHVLRLSSMISVTENRHREFRASLVAFRLSGGIAYDNAVEP